MHKNELRQKAVDAVAAYMKHELFDIGGSEMYPFLQSQAEEVVSVVDRGIERVKEQTK